MEVEFVRLMVFRKREAKWDGWAQGLGCLGYLKTGDFRSRQWGIDVMAALVEVLHGVRQLCSLDINYFIRWGDVGFTDYEGSNL